MPIDSPIFSANRQDEEPSRISRLHEVFGYARAIADLVGNRDFSSKVAELHDHKGLLTVTWKTQPTNDEKTYFVRAWESENEPTDMIEHEIQS